MSPRKLPPITHLQFLVLGSLVDGEQPGRAIRELITSHGVRSSGPAFYQMMARLERDGMVEGSYAQITVGDQAVTERRYKLRAPGQRAWRETAEFYRETAAALGRQRWSDA